MGPARAQSPGLGPGLAGLSLGQKLIYENILLCSCGNPPVAAMLLRLHRAMQCSCTLHEWWICCVRDPCIKGIQKRKSRKFHVNHKNWSNKKFSNLSICLSDDYLSNYLGSYFKNTWSKLGQQLVKHWQQMIKRCESMFNICQTMVNQCQTCVNRLTTVDQKMATLGQTLIKKCQTLVKDNQTLSKIVKNWKKCSNIITILSKVD